MGANQWVNDKKVMFSQQTTMVINRSVIGQAPVSVSLTVVGITIIMLFTAIEPEASAGLGFWQRLLFWTAQISISLVGILIASLIVRRLASAAISDLFLIVVTGLIASIIISPAFVIIESWFPNLDRVPDSLLDEFAETGFAPALLVQSIETMPALIIVWVLVNLPILLNSTFLNDDRITSEPEDEPPQPPNTKELDKAQDKNTSYSDRDQFYLKLPENIGKNIMYASSDLHYLNVTTELGSALILGSINKLADAFEDDGFLVHRSHWVNKAYVNRVVITGNNAQCIMQDKKRIPISRSKRKLLKAYFGNNNPVNTNIVKLKSN
ncbi:LytTR family DNA-binding domain-containing protein [Alteromonas sediminis]|nr:LytTR family DNA-binding domain-containing protein [Alteromonas sediminis]